MSWTHWHYAADQQNPLCDFRDVIM